MPTLAELRADIIDDLGFNGQQQTVTRITPTIDRKINQAQSELHELLDFQRQVKELRVTVANNATTITIPVDMELERIINVHVRLTTDDVNTGWRDVQKGFDQDYPDAPTSAFEFKRYEVDRRSGEYHITLWPTCPNEQIVKIEYIGGLAEMKTNCSQCQLPAHLVRTYATWLLKVKFNHDDADEFKLRFDALFKKAKMAYGVLPDVIERKRDHCVGEWTGNPQISPPSYVPPPPPSIDLNSKYITWGYCALTAVDFSLGGEITGEFNSSDFEIALYQNSEYYGLATTFNSAGWRFIYTTENAPDGQNLNYYAASWTARVRGKNSGTEYVLSAPVVINSVEYPQVATTGYTYDQNTHDFAITGTLSKALEGPQYLELKLGSLAYSSLDGYIAIDADNNWMLVGVNNSDFETLNGQWTATVKYQNLTLSTANITVEIEMSAPTITNTVIWGVNGGGLDGAYTLTQDNGFQLLGTLSELTTENEVIKIYRNGAYFVEATVFDYTEYGFGIIFVYSQSTAPSGEDINYFAADYLARIEGVGGSSNLTEILTVAPIDIFTFEPSGLNPYISAHFPYESDTNGFWLRMPILQTGFNQSAYHWELNNGTDTYSDNRFSFYDILIEDCPDYIGSWTLNIFEDGNNSAVYSMHYVISSISNELEPVLNITDSIIYSADGNGYTPPSIAPPSPSFDIIYDGVRYSYIYLALTRDLAAGESVAISYQEPINGVSERIGVLYKNGVEFWNDQEIVSLETIDNHVLKIKWNSPVSTSFAAHGYFDAKITNNDEETIGRLINRITVEQVEKIYVTGHATISGNFGVTLSDSTTNSAERHFVSVNGGDYVRGYLGLSGGNPYTYLLRFDLPSGVTAASAMTVSVRLYFNDVLVDEFSYEKEAD